MLYFKGVHNTDVLEMNKSEWLILTTRQQWGCIYEARPQNGKIFSIKKRKFDWTNKRIKNVL